MSIKHTFQSFSLFVCALIFFFLFNVQAQALTGSSGGGIDSYTSAFSNTIEFNNDGSSNWTGYETFSAGNENNSFSSSNQANSSFAAMAGGTAHYSNGDGTYSTITVATASGGGGGGGGGTPQSLVGGGGDDSGPVYRCPSGYKLYSGNKCCPNKYYDTKDTNGSKKGGKKAVCNIPKGNPVDPSGANNNTPGTTSCSVNGAVIPNGQSYTFYTTPTVPYGSSCVEDARMCVNGYFSGENNVYANCVIGPAPQIEPITIKAVPPIVRYGDDSSIVWDGANAEACTVTGYGLSNVTGVTSPSEGVPVEDVTGESVYTLHCTLGPNERSASTTLKILPRTQET